MNRERAIIQLMLTPGLGARSIAKLLKRLQGEGRGVEDLVVLRGRELEWEYGIPQNSAERMASGREEAERLTETLVQHGIQLLTLTDMGYPSMLEGRLGRQAPPVLFVRGDVSLLARPIIGFAGARECSEGGAALAREAAAVMAREGVNVVSGYAPGIDSAAHFGALSSGGVTTAVLASGMLHHCPRSELAAFSDESNTLIVSEFFPTMPWKSHSAMQRNRTICGLSRGMVIVESGVSGGTFAAGTAALEIGCPLYVVDWPDPPSSAAGNGELIRRGGVAVENGTDVVAQIRGCLDSTATSGSQARLFD